MNTTFTVDTLGLLLFTVFPGAVSLQVYRMVMAARPLEWRDVIIQGLFYSAVNFVLLSFLLPFALNGENQSTNPVLYWLALLALFVVGPILWPLVLIKLFSWKWLARRLQLPYPTAWDYYFRLRQECFVIIRLRDGKYIGGYWGARSYATSFPNDGDIYLEAVYRINPDGTFGGAVKGTLGALIRKEQYDSIEFLAVPPKSEG